MKSLLTCHTGNPWVHLTASLCMSRHFGTVTLDNLSNYSAPRPANGGRGSVIDAYRLTENQPTATRASLGIARNVCLSMLRCDITNSGGV